MATGICCHPGSDPPLQLYGWAQHLLPPILVRPETVRLAIHIRLLHMLLALLVLVLLMTAAGPSQPPVSA